VGAGVLKPPCPTGLHGMKREGSEKSKGRRGREKEEGAGGRREMSTPLNLNSASAPDKKLAVDTVFVCSVISRSNFLDLPSSKVLRHNH